MLVAVVDVVLLTAIATLGAFLYNMAAALLGGVEVTLAEDSTESRFVRPSRRWGSLASAADVRPSAASPGL